MSGSVLVGDVGGTSARFALARKGDNGHPVLEGFQKFYNDDFGSLSASLQQYVSETGAQASSALFAVAGPIENDGGAWLLNRKEWPRIEPSKLGEVLGASNVILVNDFAAMARAVPEVPASDFFEVLPGVSEPSAPILVTGPGTGFGVGTLLRLGDGKYHVITGEGGHAAYAAKSAREIELSDRLKAELAKNPEDENGDYVSTEMIVGGAWLQPVFDIVSDMHGVPRRDLEPEHIMTAAEQGDPVCLEVCELRARSIMGAVGDGVLISGAKGGAVLTGSVAERMGKWLKEPAAVARFYQRGERSDYMQNVPVRVMTSAEAPLIGAAALMFDFGVS